MPENRTVEEPLTGWRGALFRATVAIRLFPLLPGRMQGWLCDCSVCRGEA